MNLYTVQLSGCAKRRRSDVTADCLCRRKEAAVGKGVDADHQQHRENAQQLDAGIAFFFQGNLPFRFGLCSASERMKATSLTNALNR